MAGESRDVYKHEELTRQIIGCAYQVHNTLGPGLPESVYQRALCREMQLTGLAFESEKPIEVWYRDALCGEYRLDLLVAGVVIVELKALDDLSKEHTSQCITYLRAASIEVALLLNFGKKELQIKRGVN